MQTSFSARFPFQTALLSLQELRLSFCMLIQLFPASSFLENKKTLVSWSMPLPSLRPSLCENLERATLISTSLSRKNRLFDLSFFTNSPFLSKTLISLTRLSLPIASHCCMFDPSFFANSLALLVFATSFFDTSLTLLSLTDQRTDGTIKSMWSLSDWKKMLSSPWRSVWKEAQSHCLPKNHLSSFSHDSRLSSFQKKQKTNKSSVDWLSYLPLQLEFPYDLNCSVKSVNRFTAHLSLHITTTSNRYVEPQQSSTCF